MPTVREERKIDTQKVEELRNIVQKEFQENPDLYYPQDVERIKEDDWYCQRFLLHLDNPMDKAVAMVKESLQWRKKIGVYELHEDNLPTEYFELSATYPYNKDKEGNSIIYMKIKLHKKRPNEMKDVERFLVYWVEKLDRQNDGSGVSVLFDCKDSGLGNLDMDLIKFLVDLFKNYYPYTLGYLIVYDMPWLFSAAWKIIKTWLPKSSVDRVKFVSGDAIFDLVAKEMLPVDVGGTDNREYVYKAGSYGTVLQPWSGLKEKTTA